MVRLGVGRLSEGFRWLIFILAGGLYWLTENWIFIVGWALFECSLALYGLLDRKSNGLFDQVTKKALELGFEVEFISSADCEAGLNFKIDDGRNIYLKIRVFEYKPDDIGFFTYLIFDDQINSMTKNVNTGLHDLEENLQSIKREMAVDKYQPLSHS